VEGSKNEQRIALSQPRRLSKKKVIALISRYSQVFIFKHRNNKHKQELKYHSIFILTYLVVLIIERKGKERKRINNTNQKSINGKTKKKTQRRWYSAFNCSLHKYHDAQFSSNEW
jgi:uncharacterized protein Veg